MFFDRGIMGLRPTQGDEKRLLFSGSASPPPCHPDRSAAQWRDLRFGGTFLGMFSTEESTAFGPPKVMKNGFCSATTVDGGTALPFIISTEAYPDFLRRAAGNGHMCGSP
jgi:hypothetical protein